MSTLGVGVIGYGYAGRAFHAYLVSLERESGLHLAAIATSDPARQASARRDHPDARIHPGAVDVLADVAVDLVVVATPHDTHRDLVLAALRAGRHVVVDKIMSMNAAEADEMIDAAAKYGRVLTVFHNRRWDWDYLTLRSCLDQGLIGAPYLFESTVFGYGEPRGWRGSAARGGGVLFDWGAHLVDQALQLVPAGVARVECVTQARRWTRTDAGSYGRISLHFDNGVLFVVEVGNLARRGKPRWFVLGEDGAFVRQDRDPQEPFLVQGRIDAAREPSEAAAEVAGVIGGRTAQMRLESVRGSWRAFYRNVADAILRGSPLAVRAEEARRTAAVFDAAVLSDRLHEPIRPDGE